MLYFRLAKLSALLIIPAAIVRAVITTDSTKWTYSFFLIYCGLLVATIAKYAQENLRGQKRYNRFGLLLLLTSLALYLTYSFHSILTFAVGWIASGWGATLLVDHFNDKSSRSARNKVARYFFMSDVCILVVATYSTINRIDLFATHTAPLFLVGLLALAGLIRSGAFPFHRWLALTNEAPSPLSALLHAGIVNGFGLALLSFPSLRELQVPIVVLGLITIFFALVIMRHRHDEKGKLANGTSMQMAYMAIEGALGLNAAVLLHIVGHGSYKSWSFLRVGGVPSRWKKSQELYLPRYSGSSLYQALTLMVSGLLVLGVFGLALLLHDSALTLALLTISLTSLLGFTRQLQPWLFAQTLVVVTGSVALLVAETYGLSHLIPGHGASKLAVASVAFSIIAMTLVVKKFSYETTVKLCSRLLGFVSAPRRSIVASNDPLIAATLQRYTGYFEPGLGLSTMVAQDPVSGLHSQRYQEAAKELSRFGIASYLDQPDGISSHSPGFYKAIDQASWWTAEASHNSSVKSLGPYSLWRESHAAKSQVSADPSGALAAFIQESSLTREEALAALIGSDLGWFQYFLGKHPDWIAELLALRAALFLTHNVELERPVEVDLQSHEETMTLREKAEVQQLLQKLQGSTYSEGNDRPEVALVMCIDVRSEKMRRLLETRHSVATLGFAGFFGADIAVVTSDGSHSFQNQMCPVILQPGIAISNTEVPNIYDIYPTLWSQANRGSGALAMAEGFGLVQLCLNLINTYTPTLFKRRTQKQEATVLNEEAYAAIPFESKVALATVLMNNLPLQNFTEVIFVGHESGVPNNPFTSLYECGACGGNSGLVNAYYAAKLLNDSEVMKAAGFSDCSTLFGYAMHNTTHQTLEILSGSQKTASLKTDSLLTQQDKNLGAWWQPFPEFGLAGNVGAIIAPRALTANVDLRGKYFLHDYDVMTDPDGSKLANILSGPGAVMQMINSQYNFTVCDPRNFSAGDKTRLNVFTQAGALAGSGGSLKRGMPWQAIGESADQPIHNPIRLQIFIAAPRQLIDQALAQSSLAETVVNGWITVHSLQSEEN